MTNKTEAMARRNLSLGYALPIIGGAVAIVFGLIVYDLTRTTFDIWIWVIIQSVLGVSLVLGTTLSNAAFNFAVDSGKAFGATRGAKNLNFILGIIWSSIVTVMAFATAASAISGLRSYSDTPAIVNPKGTPMPSPSATSIYIGPGVKPLTASFIFGDMLPALVLLAIAVVGIYLLLAQRSRGAAGGKSAGSHSEEEK